MRRNLELKRQMAMQPITTSTCALVYACNAKSSDLTKFFQMWMKFCEGLEWSSVCGLIALRTMLLEVGAMIRLNKTLHIRRNLLLVVEVGHLFLRKVRGNYHIKVYL